VKVKEFCHKLSDAAISLLSRSDFLWSLVSIRRNWFEDCTSPPTDLEKSIVEDLKRDGISCFHLSEILSAQEYSSVEKEIGSTWEREPTVSNKDFLEYYFGGKYPDEMQFFDPQSSFWRLANHSFFRRVVSNYLGDVSKLIYVELNRTKLRHSAELEGSQKIHRDPALRSCLKIFIYWNNVNREGGPFVYFPETHFHGRFFSKFRSGRFVSGSHYLSVNDQSKLRKLTRPLSCVGAKGTVILCDTSGFHFGGISKTKTREMSTFVYYPRIEPRPVRVKERSGS